MPLDKSLTNMSNPNLNFNHDNVTELRLLMEILKSNADRRNKTQ